MSAIVARTITAGYGSVPVVKGMSIEAEAGDIVAIIGANGAGKSTFLKALFGLLPLTSGSIAVSGSEVAHVPSHERVRHGLAYMPQMPANVFQSLTVTENLEVGGYTQGANVKAQISDVFSLFPELAVAAKKKAGALSGGQRQLLALARSLMSRPRVILLDEPTAGLSPLNSFAVWKQIELVASQGPAVVVVEQNVDSALDHAGCIYVMGNGSEVLRGTAEDLRRRNLGAIFLNHQEAEHQDMVSE